MNNKYKITKKDLLRTAFRHFIGVGTFNYDTGIASSLVWEMFPVLRKIYSNDDDLIASLNNHFKYYNCNPWLSPLITGATLAMEEKDGTDSLEAVQSLKTGLMGPLSGIGDTIIWVMMPTIFGSIAGSMGKQGNPLGMWLFLLVYFMFFLLRPYVYILGYNSGTSLIDKLGNKMEAFTDSISVLGIMVIGSIVSSTVSIKTGWVFSNGGVKISLQSILDKICPSLLPAVLVATLYVLLKKKVKMSALIILVILVSMLGAAIGLFTV
ncbi:PTS system mannose/fructose/sorbose family transporter subunit IID [Lactobacillus sp. ESL0791]|uniref:PTS system mannose/fructose/sorbose family transporter subunit IID n=1 Tax=Lactobacillus sp. ESL0791 TaxID=2983234 RepID=UPI0023F7D146|nr:PTS system mannose/fructose/sorbose family transporter subunit IID [Lactobacillus sp. ESL0791]MDF7638039.1 PTS system mannose/fructose/sorbose family transporter subunit IID [Lactobacillus sp. ESL0791]